MRYKVQVNVDLVVEVPDGTTDDEFYEAYHNLAGVSITATSGDEEKVKIISCLDEVMSYEKIQQET